MAMKTAIITEKFWILSSSSAETISDFWKSFLFLLVSTVFVSKLLPLLFAE